VVRVDRPGGAEIGIDPAQDVTGRGKRSVLVDLKEPGGAEAVLALADRADLFVEGFRPGVAERLGIGPGVCLARRPRLVYGRMTGWGQDGPLAERAGHDLTYLARSGVLGMIGSPDGPPAIPANLLGDYAGGALYLVTGLLAALHHARTTGTGQVVDAAIVDGAAHLTSMMHALLGAGVWQDRRGVNLLDGGSPFYGCYRTADGGWMAVGPLERRFYEQFVTLLGLDDGALPDRDDPGEWGKLRDAVAARFATRTRAEWTALFDGTDACVAPVNSLREAPADPHLAARGTFTELAGSIQPAPAPRFSGTPTALRTPPAVPGAHAAEVARDWDVPELSPRPAAEHTGVPGPTEQATRRPTP
jgi:alpha-methylacyl-CoA racemase